MSNGGETRRRALARIGGLGVLAAGLGRLERPAAAGASGRVLPAGPQALGLRRFVSRPDLTPPALAVAASAHAPAGPPYLFLTAPASGPARAAR